MKFTTHHDRPKLAGSFCQNFKTAAQLLSLIVITLTIASTSFALTPEVRPDRGKSATRLLVEDLQAQQEADPSPMQLQLSGRWVGKHQDSDGNTVFETTVMRADGSFRFVMSEVDGDAQTDTFVQEGLWGVSNGIHWTQILRHSYGDDGVKPCRHGDRAYLVYDIVELTDTTFRYRSRLSGTTFVLTRPK